MAIKYYKDGEWKIFPGTIGPSGKDAYQIAQEGGYTGTREEYTSSLVNLPELAKQVEANTEAIENLDLGVKFEKVDVLPVSGNSSTIYLVPVSEGVDGNVYSEYLYIDDAWENIGSTQVDLTNYATEAWVSSNYQPKGNYLTSVPEGYITESELASKNYATKTDLENITPDLSSVYTKEEIDNKGYLTEIPAEYVTETELSAMDYATKSEIPTDFYTKSEVDTKISEIQAGDVDLTSYYTKTESDDKYQPKGDYLTSDSLEGYALSSEIPTDYVSETTLQTYKEEVSNSYYDTTETKRVIAVTQEEYNALTDKDENALYFIVDDEGNIVQNTIDGDLTVTGSVTTSSLDASSITENGQLLSDKYLSDASVFAPAHKYYTETIYAGYPGICDFSAIQVGSAIEVNSIYVTAIEPTAIIVAQAEADITFNSTLYKKSFTDEDTTVTEGYKCYAITYVNDSLALVNFSNYK